MKPSTCTHAFFLQWRLQHHCTCNKANLTVWILVSACHHCPDSVIHHCYNVQVKFLKHKSQSLVGYWRKREHALTHQKEQRIAHISSPDSFPQHINNIFPFTVCCLKTFCPSHKRTLKQKRKKKQKMKAERRPYTPSVSLFPPPPPPFFFFNDVTSLSSNSNRPNTLGDVLWGTESWVSPSFPVVLKRILSGLPTNRQILLLSVQIPGHIRGCLD